MYTDGKLGENFNKFFLIVWVKVKINIMHHKAEDDKDTFDLTMWKCVKRQVWL